MVSPENMIKKILNKCSTEVKDIVSRRDYYENQTRGVRSILYKAKKRLISQFKNYEWIIGENIELTFDTFDEKGLYDNVWLDIKLKIVDEVIASLEFQIMNMFYETDDESECDSDSDDE